MLFMTCSDIGRSRVSRVAGSDGLNVVLVLEYYCCTYYLIVAAKLPI